MKKSSNTRDIMYQQASLFDSFQDVTYEEIVPLADIIANDFFKTPESRKELNFFIEDDKTENENSDEIVTEGRNLNEHNNKLTDRKTKKARSKKPFFPTTYTDAKEYSLLGVHLNFIDDSDIDFCSSTQELGDGTMDAYIGAASKVFDGEYQTPKKLDKDTFRKMFLQYQAVRA